MQLIFGEDQDAAKAFRETISEARFARYLKEGQGDVKSAIQLYHWNALLSQAMYLPLQMWEVSLRNKLNRFLISRYNQKWPYDTRALRELSRDGQRRLQDTKDRLDPQQRVVQIPTDAIVADLSAGFWVSLLTKKYDVPFAWRYNLLKVFPGKANERDRLAMSEMCDRMLVLRNRVAHHEPIFQLDLVSLKAELDELIGGMCPAGAHYSKTTCTFAAVWAARPAILPPANDPDAEAAADGGGAA